MRPHPERKDHISIPAPYQNLRNAYYPSQHPSMADLDQTLREVIRQSSNTYLVIDALDECESERVQGQLLKFLNTLAMDIPNLHILSTSRPEFNIRAAFDGLEATKFRVPFDDSAVDSDIHEHLGMLMSQQPYTRWSQALQSKVVSELSQKADGVFRWAGLHVQQLQGKLREIDVERALKRLPGDLAGTYQRILEKIEFDIDGQEATALLRWLSRSRRPLTLLEVAEIAAFEVRNGEDIQLSPEAGDYEVIFSPRNRFDDFTEVLCILSGLVSVSVSSDSEEQDSIVSFSHSSVKEYLLSSLVSPSTYRLTPLESDWFITKCCLAYIRYYDSSKSDGCLETSYPLLLYSCLRLFEHLPDASLADAWSSIGKQARLQTRAKNYALSLALFCGGIRSPVNYNMHQELII